MSDGPENRTQVVYRGTGFYVGLAAILVFAVVLLIVAVQNTQDVTVAFLGLEFRVPLFAVAIGAGLLAVILDELIGLVWRHQRRTQLEERAELATLRADRRDAPAAETPAREGPGAETPAGETPAADTRGDHETPPKDSQEEVGSPPRDLDT
jgi:uncharacterized integral membrane protein